MANKAKISLGIALDGEKEFKNAISDINNNLKTLDTEMKAVTSAYDKNDRSAEKLTAQNKVLNKQINDQKLKLEGLKSALAKSADEVGENDKQTEKWQQEVNKATAELNKMERELSDNNAALKDVERGFNAAGNRVDKFGKEIKQTADETDKASDQSSRLSDIFKGGFFANIASNAISMVTSELKEFVSSSITAADAAGTNAEIYGLTVARMQELAYAGVRLDTSVETIAGSMTKLTRSMNSARAGSKLQAEAFQTLGIEITNADGTLRDARTVWGEAIDALGSMSNETERNAAAMQLFGKSAMDLNPLIKAGSAEMEKLSQEAHTAGAVMSDEAVVALDNLGETLEQAKISARSFVGEALASIIGDGKTAAETMQSLQNSLSENSNIQSLIEKYRSLSKQISNSAMSTEEAKEKSVELEQAKQDLISASNGVVTAFDIENGTFDAQVGVLEDLTKSEKDYLKYKLTNQVLENSGVELIKKATAADKKYAEAKENLVATSKAVAESEEAIASGRKRDMYGTAYEAKLESQTAAVELFRKVMAEASATQLEVSDSALKAQEAIRALVENGYMDATEACATFALSSGELKTILSGTGASAESSIPQVQALKESIDLLDGEFAAAKLTIDATLQSLIGGWQSAPEVVALSAEAIAANLQSQLDYMLSYRNNLDALVSRAIPGVDMSALISSLSDGTLESAQVLAGLSTATDNELTQIAQLYAAKGNSMDSFTDGVAATQVDYDKQLADLVTNTQKAVDDMDLAEDAKISAANTINGYINGVKSKSGSLNLAMTTAAQDALKAWKKVFKEKSPSREMAKSGVNAILGNIKGVESKKTALIAEYARAGQLAINSMTAALSGNIAVPSSITSNLSGLGAGTSGSISSPNNTGGIIQNVTINSPTPLSPSQIARESKNAMRRLAWA